MDGWGLKDDQGRAAARTYFLRGQRRVRSVFQHDSPMALTASKADMFKLPLDDVLLTASVKTTIESLLPAVVKMALYI
jgi:hypothetical protein